MPLSITEGQKFQDDWYKEAREMTVEKLPAFIHKLVEDYNHDYGTICHAIAVSALAAARAIDHSKVGGITGFQAGCVMWEWVSRWMHLEGKPLKLVEFQNMLYPQYEDSFTTITSGTWEWLRKEAKRLLTTGGKGMVDSSVWVHWETVADGKVPFGYKVREED